MASRGDDDIRIEMVGGSVRKLFKQLLGLWAVAYPILSILPLLSTGTSTTGATAVGGLASLILGSVLFGPWIIGIIILGVLVLVSPGPTPVIRRVRPERPAESEYADADYWKSDPTRPSLLTRLTRLGYNDPPDDEAK